MYATVIEILLVWVAFIFGVYQQHFQHLLRAIWYPDLWESAVNSILSLQTLFPIILLVGLSVGIYFLNRYQDKSRNKDTELLIDKVIQRTGYQRNQEIQSLISPLLERIDKLIKKLDSN